MSHTIYRRVYRLICSHFFAHIHTICSADTLLTEEHKNILLPKKIVCGVCERKNMFLCSSVKNIPVTDNVPQGVTHSSLLTISLSFSCHLSSNTQAFRLQTTADILQNFQNPEVLHSFCQSVRKFQ